MWYRTSSLTALAEAHTSVIVALFLPKSAARKLALKDADLPDGVDGEDASDLHITLAYIGKAAELKEKRDKIKDVLKLFGSIHAPVEGEISGIGRFSHGAFYASYDSPCLPEFRQDLVKTLRDNGVEIAENHGFTPHITLSTLNEGDATPDHTLVGNFDVRFTRLVLCWGDHQTEFRLTGKV